jgi:hypothetical protein
MRNPDDRDLVDALILVDGLHAGRDESDPTDSLYAGIVDYARAALDEPSRRLLVVTNSEIIPPYASTTAVAAELLDHLGIPVGSPQRPRKDHAELPGLRVVDWRSTRSGATGKDHVDHLKILAPQLLREAVVPFVRQLAPGRVPPWLSRALPLGERAVLWSREQMRRELKPSETTIARWFSHSMRNGHKLGITRGNHCAAAACAAAVECAGEEERIPHLPRAAAKEIMADALEANAWHPVDEVRQGAWTPAVGDLAVYDRSRKGQPATAWWGHVDRVSGPIDPDAGGYWNIGANEGPGGAWREQLTHFAAERLLGFVAYPPLPPAVTEPKLPAPPSPGFEVSDDQRRKVWQVVALTLDQAEREWWEERDG